MAQGWWKTDNAAVAAYTWDPAEAPAWPGVRMNPVEGETDLWSMDVDTKKVTKVIFVRVNGDGDIQDWGAKTADLTIPTDENNLYTITSTEPVWGDPGCAGEWSIYTASNTSAVDNITTTVAPVKMIQNGQLVIIRDGVKYNVQGAVVK